MAIIYSYPTATPKVSDLLVISNGSKKTKSASISSIIDLINTGLLPGVGTVTSIGVSAPSAFTVANSPITSTGTIIITGAGATSQYIDGTGALQSSANQALDTTSSVTFSTITGNGSAITNIDKYTTSYIDTNIYTKTEADSLFTSGFVGAITPTSTAPTQDGLYSCSTSGTYTNFGGEVVSLSNQVVSIAVENNQTTFTQIVTPTGITFDSTPTAGSTNAVESEGIKTAIDASLGQIVNFYDLNNLFNVDNIVDGSYISSTTGNINSASGWGFSGFIDISSYPDGQEFTLSGQRDRAGFAFSVDNSGTTSVTGSYIGSSTLPLTVTKPLTANYMYFNLYYPSGTTYSNVMINVGSTALPWEKFGRGIVIKNSVLPPIKIANLKLNGIGSEATVTGLVSKRIIEPFKEVQVSGSRVFNFKTDEVNDVVFRENTTDDVAPCHVLGTTLLANHSYFGYEVDTNGNHLKTDSDIGSVYSYGGNEYTLIDIQSNDELWVIGDTLGDILPESITLSYVSGGSTTNDIVIDTHKYKQAFPCSSDYNLDILIDGVKETSNTGTFYYENNVVFNETYNLIKRDDIITWYQTNYSSNLKPTGDVLIYNNISYSFDVDGNCTISGDYSFNDIISVEDIMALQATSVTTLAKYYIPKTIAFTQDSTNINFSLIENSNVIDGETITFDSSKLDSSSIPSDRWMQLSSDGTKGFAMGFLPVASAGINRSSNTTDMTMQRKGGSNKMYPRLLDIGNHTSSLGDAYSYIAYRNVFVPQNSATANYLVRTKNDDFYFIDYHNASGVFQFDMPIDFIGRTFEVNESRNITCNSQVITNKLTINVNCLSDYGYLVIKISK